MITIKDIARYCKVSPSTVSRALADSSLLPEQTRVRIQEAASKLGYVKNEMATSLKTGVNKTVGVINFVGENLGYVHYLFAQVLNGFSNRINEMGYDDIQLISEKNLYMGEKLLPYLHAKHLSGLLVLSGHLQSEAMRTILGSDIPTVVVDPRDEQILNLTGCISSDNCEGMYRLTESILKKGHRNIVYIAGEDYYVTHERVKGFKKALADSGVEFDEQMIVSGNFYNLSTVRQNIAKILARENVPTCIVFSDDYCAVHGYDVLRSFGLTIGKDISVAGFDGIELGRHMQPKLTTVVQNAVEMGRLAADALIGYASGAAKANVLIPTELKETDSVVVFAR